MYVSYTPPLSELLGVLAAGAGSACNGREADARTRTGDPFITRKALAPNTSPRQGTPAPISTAIHADTQSGPAAPLAAQETRPVYAIYTPTAHADRFTQPFHDAGDPGGERTLEQAIADITAAGPEHCFTCGRRLAPRDPSPYCAGCRDDDPGPGRHEEPLRR
jgi:hypothetical protein